MKPIQSYDTVDAWWSDCMVEAARHGTTDAYQAWHSVDSLRAINADLLAALDVCTELLAHDVRLNVAGPREIAALKQAREAYAKATGGS